MSKLVEDKEREFNLQQKLVIKLNDVESLFEYYLQSTENRAKENGDPILFNSFIYLYHYYYY